jgi:hypothetical protein
MRNSYLAISLYFLTLVSCCAKNVVLLQDPAYLDYMKLQNELVPYKNEADHLGYDHLWAGDYCAFSPLGENQRLIVVPISGFYYECNGDIGPCGSGRGHAAYSDGKVILTCDYCAFYFPTCSSELVVVKWGNRNYLIPENAIPRFAESIKRGAEPRSTPYGGWLLRENDWQLIATGFPDLPDKYKHLLYEKTE